MADAAIIQTSTLDAIADAIVAKGGASGKLTPLEMPAAIESIKSGPVGRSDVNFYDADGTLLYSYTREEIAKLKELPTPPPLEHLVFTNWNHTLEQIKDITAGGCEADVGAIYQTDTDGGRGMKIVVNIPTSGIADRTIMFALSATDGSSAVIDYGDGSKIDYASGPDAAVTHAFPAAGEYVITISPMTESGFFYLFEVTDESTEGKAFAQSVRKIFFGKNVGIFAGIAGTVLHFLQSLTLPEGVRYMRVSGDLPTPLLAKYLSVTHLNIPVSMASLTGDSTTLGYNLLDSYVNTFDKPVAVPSTTIPPGSTPFVSSLANRSTSLRGKQEICLSSGSPDELVTLPASAFYQCSNLRKLSVYPGLQRCQSTDFTNCSALEEIITATHPLYGASSSTWSGCTSLKYIPDISVTGTVSNQAFRNCQSLSRIVIRDCTGFESSASKIFAGCIQLREIDLSKNATNLAYKLPSDAFDDINYPVCITVRVQSTFLSSYKTTTNMWNTINNKNVTFNFIGV